MGANENELVWLQEWYVNQCNGDWEHQWGVTVESLDNPGWTLSIDLRGTNLEGRIFQDLSIERTAVDWVNCRIEKQTFKGAGGPRNLTELIAGFRRWAENAA